MALAPIKNKTKKQPGKRPWPHSHSQETEQEGANSSLLVKIPESGKVVDKTFVFLFFSQSYHPSVTHSV